MRLRMTEQVFDWKHYDGWSVPVLRAFETEITPRLMNLVRSSDVFLADDLEWLSPIRAQAGIKSTADLPQVLADRFSSVFTAIRVYHACRPKDPETYYLHGFRALTPVEMLKAALVQIPALIPGTTAEEIRQAHNNVRPKDRADQVNFTLDSRIFTEKDGIPHYHSFYGGEYLQALAVNLPSGGSNRASLESTGIPTVFGCDVPVSDVSSESILILSRDVVGELFRQIRKRSDLPTKDFTIRLERTVSPKTIVDHFHPKVGGSQLDCSLCTKHGRTSGQRPSL